MTSDKFITFRSDMIDSVVFFDNFDDNKRMLQMFAKQQGIPEEAVDRFIWYNLPNGMDGSLCDRSGNPFRNVFGAFLRFATSGYDRTKWEEEHGIHVPEWVRRKRMSLK